MAGIGSVVAYDQYTRQRLLSNIVAFSTAGVGIQVDPGSTVTADHNCVFGNFDGEYSGDAVPGPNDLNVDPFILDLVRANVRVPDQVVGDLMANVTCNEVGGRQLLEFMDEYGLDDLTALSAAIRENSERAKTSPAYSATCGARCR